jgi:hypothetical protein
MNEDDEVMRDDEELPFSAEQSDQLTTRQNKIKIRRNQTSKPQSQRLSSKRQKPAMSPRKMVRRGMEMLVGGVAINADPPQRYVELLYRHDAQWHEVITINTRDFGPMFHTSSVSMLSKKEQGLYCEHFVHSTMKWDVCPKDLKAIVKGQTTSKESIASTSLEVSDVETRVSTHYDELNSDSHVNVSFINDDDMQEGDMQKPPPNRQARRHPKKSDSPVPGFGKVAKNKNGSATSREEVPIHLGGELVFSIGVSKQELDSGENGSQGRILERVLARGIAAASESTGFDVRFTKLVLTDMDDGTTMINGEFTLEANESMSFSEMEKKAQRINSSLAQATDDGDLQLAMASAAREETSWPEDVRDRVVEEFLFEDDDGDGPLYDTEEDEPEGATNGMADKHRAPEDTLSSLKDMEDDDNYDYDGPFGMPGSNRYPKDDIFLGGGNDGVFWDYSEANAANSPYKGELGPRLVDAVVEKAKTRQPRVIAIGDVHGCIDELQDLLRECDYRPGDLVVFLGDLVSKGPDSISVVQMAREIGAMGVRGNHDFEVIRWHQAIKSGVDPPVVGSEHFHIASCLNNADMKWLYSLPWYLSSKELGALFVHAGFVSGIRLAKQNPRLMMNMRSILPDGTVTSKFFNNWPWARLWDGPQTVLFGHDADRGLQQYEHAIGLDTGCVYGGRLTACILPEKRLVSVRAKREYFKYRRKHYD